MPVLREDRLEFFLSSFPRLRIAVVGDLFLDQWLEVDRGLDEVSLETGLTAYQVVRKRLYAGAAGTVLANLAALEAGELYAIGFTGDDGEGFELRRKLAELSVNTGALAVLPDRMTPTYTKPVFLQAPEGKFIESHRFDHRNTQPVSRAAEDAIIFSLHKIAEKVDAIIALDQLTAELQGVLGPRVREALTQIAASRAGLIVYADSRAFISRFRRIIIKCNDHEAMRIVHPEKTIPFHERIGVEELIPCLRELEKSSGGRVFISCGAQGVLVRDKNGTPLLVPAIPVPPPVDTVGAGDACSSGIVGALCCGASGEEAAALGNIVASITIQTIGSTGTASPSQVRDRYAAAFHGAGGGR
ncbi:MAG: PfkB family carbohydrate kinase [Spirochaetaceae bacterium]|jgi:bifunctional ADP-heptose synthase (sugar kinase/adenylyltransferase)|nr:PfkB family carbohydrate kinase [Spirochaetaceae bacterium]